MTASFRRAAGELSRAPKNPQSHLDIFDIYKEQGTEFPARFERCKKVTVEALETRAIVVSVPQIGELMARKFTVC
jgi:hypothetical protein